MVNDAKGRSAIYGGEGRVLAQAGPEGDVVLRAEIRPAETRDKSFDPLNNVLADRRPELDSRLTAE